MRSNIQQISLLAETALSLPTLGALFLLVEGLCINLFLLWKACASTVFYCFCFFAVCVFFCVFSASSQTEATWLTQSSFSVCFCCAVSLCSECELVSGRGAHQPRRSTCRPRRSSRAPGYCTALRSAESTRESVCRCVSVFAFCARVGCA